MNPLSSLTPLTPAQLRAHLPELIGLLQDGVESGASIGFVCPLAADVAQSYWDEVIRDTEAGARIVLGLMVDGHLVGSVQLGLCGKPNGRHRAEVQKLLVHTRHRRQGFGRQLMAALEEEARRAGRTLLYLDTEPQQPAEAMYRRLGWILAGEIPDYACTPDGVLHGTSIFYKKLTP